MYKIIEVIMNLLPAVALILVAIGNVRCQKRIDELEARIKHLESECTLYEIEHQLNTQSKD